MMCTENRQAPSSAFDAREREMAEGTGLNNSILKCQQGEKINVQMNTNDAGNPLRVEAQLSPLGSMPSMLGGSEGP